MGGVQGVWQSSWFMCEKCGVLFRADADFIPFAAAPAETAGACPGGGTHDGEGGSRFAVLVGDSGTNDLLAGIDVGDPSAQSGWSWCTNCSGLFLRAANPNVCPQGNQPHHPLNPIVILPPAHVLQYAVRFDYGSFLPHGHACTSGAGVDFKVNTNTVIGWYTLCSGNWDSSPQSPWQFRFEGGGSDTVAAAELSVRMDPGGGCIIDTLVLRLTESGTSTLKQQMPSLNDDLLRALGLNLLGSQTPMPCTNFFAGSFDDCEYGGGSNNNGVGTFVTGQALGAQLWPKREDRIRFDAVLPGGTIASLELDTQE